MASKKQGAVRCQTLDIREVLNNILVKFLS